MAKGLPAAAVGIFRARLVVIIDSMLKGRVGRKLTPGEVALAQSVFKKSIPYDKVRVHEGLFFHIPWDQKFMPDTDAWDLLCWALIPGYRWFWSELNTAVSSYQLSTGITPRGEIFFSKDVYKSDYSKAAPYFQEWFIHELVHCWQHFSGVDVLGRRIESTLLYGLTKFDSADDHDNDAVYEFSMDTKTWTDWPSLKSWGLEQQASMVGAYFWYKNKHGIRAADDVSPGAVSPEPTYALSVEHYKKLNQIVEAAFD